MPALFFICYLNVCAAAVYFHFMTANDEPLGHIPQIHKATKWVAINNFEDHVWSDGVVGKRERGEPNREKIENERQQTHKPHIENDKKTEKFHRISCVSQHTGLDTYRSVVPIWLRRAMFIGVPAIYLLSKSSRSDSEGRCNASTSYNTNKTQKQPGGDTASERWCRRNRRRHQTALLVVLSGVCVATGNSGLMAITSRTATISTETNTIYFWSYRAFVKVLFQ